MPSPSNATAISVRFLFLVPLMLHTLAAFVRPLLWLAACGRDASVKGAPISISDDMTCPTKCLGIVSSLGASRAESLSSMLQKKVRASNGRTEAVNGRELELLASTIPL
jgi:hypothetical protein